MVDGKAKGQQITEVRILTISTLLRKDFSCCTFGFNKLGDSFFVDGHIPEEFSSFRSFLARVNKDKGLILAGLIEDLFIADFVHDLVAFDSLLLGDTDELLLETTRPVSGVEIE